MGSLSPTSVYDENENTFVRFFEYVERQTAEKVIASERLKYGPGGTGSLNRTDKNEVVPTHFDLYFEHDSEKWGDGPRDVPAEWPDD